MVYLKLFQMVMQIKYGKLIIDYEVDMVLLSKSIIKCLKSNADVVKYVENINPN